MSMVEKINAGYKEFQFRTMMGMIDHTLLKPDTTVAEIKQHCEEAKTYGFKSVCVFPEQVYLCRKLLKKTDIGITTVVGFPFGENTTKTKVVETKQAIKDGATEIDMVASLSNIVRGKFRLVRADIESVVRAAKKHPVKVIIEISKLTDKQIEKVVKCCIDSNADFVKTSTGFIGEPTTMEQVLKLNKIVDGSMGIKAAGGIKTAAQMLDLCEAGATRIGTSHAVEIAEEFRNNIELLHVVNMEAKAEDIDKERVVVEEKLEKELQEQELPIEKTDEVLGKQNDDDEKKGFFAFFKKKPKTEEELAKEEAEAKAKEDEKLAKAKAKEEEKAAKAKAKEEEKAAKEKAKEEERQEKEKAKEEADAKKAALKEEDLKTEEILDKVFEAQDSTKDDEDLEEMDDEVASEDDVNDLYKIDGAEIEDEEENED